MEAGVYLNRSQRTCRSSVTRARSGNSCREILVETDYKGERISFLSFDLSTSSFWFFFTSEKWAILGTTAFARGTCEVGGWAGFAKKLL